MHVWRERLHRWFEPLARRWVRNLHIQAIYADALVQATSVAGAGELLQGLPRGWDTVLSRRYDVPALMALAIQLAFDGLDRWLIPAGLRNRAGSGGA